MRLHGKIAAVTGGSGGLGGAIAQGLADEGATVTVLDRARTSSKSTLEHIDVDVRDPEQLRFAYERIEHQHGRLDALVVSAGVQLHGEDGPLGETSLETWTRTLDVNLTGAFLSIKYALPLLVASAHGSLILIGSPTGLTMSGAGYSAYSASKAGMMALSRIVAADYAAAGVRSNVIVPGTMNTPLITGLLADENTRAALLSGTPLGRLGEPDDLVGITTWLASDESRFATGAMFAVDGGMTAR